MNNDCELTDIRRLLVDFVVWVLCVLFAMTVGGCEGKKAGLTGKPTKDQSHEAATVERKVVFQSSLAGLWYSADVNELRQQISTFYDNANVQPAGDVIALILPHAGYVYSGQTAVCGVKAAGGNYRRIIVIGPTHSLPMEDLLAVPTATHYRTPIGEVPLDVEFIARLLKYPMFQAVPAAHEQEHSVQIEIPLLQFKRQTFKLVPIVVGQCSYDTIVRAGSILKSFIDDSTLIVASSDFVHYGPRYEYVPFTDDVAARIKKLDMGAYEYIKRLDARGFLDYTAKTGATICGRIPIAILLSMLDSTTKAGLIKYTTSGELTGDFSNSVSYVAVAFSGKLGHTTEVEPKKASPALSEQDKSQLLVLARKTILYVLHNKRLPDAPELGIEPTEPMKVPRAAFVTLKKNSQLRGCIGDIFPQRPLYRSVILNAANAALRDWRFQQVTESECGQIEIEISALTVPSSISSASEIRLGTDGVVMNKDGHSAVFLPQVATEQGWGLEEMLSNLSVKAGLPADAWMKGAGFLVFQAEVFGEKQ
jgi:AmmeMemoRadiSam system protein B/AmmeMemoRadiSam system protein A